MSLDYAALRARRLEAEPLVWNESRVSLYALAIGMGRDPLDPDELPFVYEDPALRVVPGFASTLAGHSLLAGCGWDQGQVLHVGECLTVYRPLAESGSALLSSRVRGLRDLGAERGLLIDLEAEGRDHDGGLLFRVQRQLLARADGGGGGDDALRPRALPPPDRAPDLDCRISTRADQALLYRQTGDRNPLHVDPEAARAAGWERPPLQGLCTWGMACRAILQTICEFDPTLIRSMEARLTAPVFPGDTLRTDMWQQANVVSFRMRAEERDSVVLDHGRCELVA